MSNPSDQTPSDSGGPAGGSERRTRWERRMHLRCLEAIVYDGWQVPASAFADLPRNLHDILQDPAQSTRDRIRAGEALAHLVAHRADAAVQYDRIMRLDAGEATDRIAVYDSLSDAQLAAVAATLRRSAPTCPPDSPAPGKPQPEPQKPRQSRRRS